MPYVKPADRDLLDDGMPPESAGQLNYIITRLCDEYIVSHGLSYTSVNEVMGVLECAKLELYRRIIAPYEDDKLDENGDVYSEENLP